MTSDLQRYDWAPPAPPHGVPPPARAFRDRDRRWVAGVAAGLARHLGWQVLWVRVGFVVLTVTTGLGPVLYAAYWFFLPLGSVNGAASGSRAGGRKADREEGLLPLLAVGALLLGGSLLASNVVRSWGVIEINRSLLAAAVLAGLGAAIIWRQADDDQWARSQAGGRRWWPLVVGGTLIAAAAFIALADAVDPTTALRGLAVGGVAAVGIVVLAMPWVRSRWEVAERERAELIRAAERAEVAAQVHDSVLQTLTLIRANATDHEAVQRLARAEERRLRTWLYQPQGSPESAIRAALEDAAAAVEARAAVTIDVVVVGDAAMSPRLSALLAATSEALTNAAKHGGGDISLFCEVEPGGVSVFVRDRGPGFDITAVPQDRLGVRQSILGRMERNGGSADIRATGAGTEVRLHMPTQDAA